MLIKESAQVVDNFNVMKSILFSGDKALIPQLSFDYQGISTREFLKTVRFDPDILKGDYDSTTTRLYPFGYVLYLIL